MKQAIYPTHECFNDALEVFEQMAKERNPFLHSGRLHLVHAVCLTPDGEEYAHAWVEQDEKIVIFAGIVNGAKSYFAADAAEYYAESRVKETTKYTVRQALELNNLHETYGPWTERYLKLCRQPGEPRRVWPATPDE
jgi:hypothetical protein